MSIRFVARIVFVVAMALSLSASLAGTAIACGPETDPGLCSSTEPRVSCIHPFRPTPETASGPLSSPATPTGTAPHAVCSG